ncbi:MAG: nuclear transport factor 2 family protein [Chloroflexi bacterium]|nr:nuclear transport factor 2 family protein [Chloroflexota bacterium]
MALTGKGFFVWQIPNCENGDTAAIASLAQQASLSHVLIKVADNVHSYNVTSAGVDLAAPLVQALRTRGIQPWGWHYIYGDDPLGEADKANQRISQLGLDGYVLDVETQYKDPGKARAAEQFMDRLRSAHPNLPVALCSYRFPSLHPQIPWRQFLDGCNYNMPQVYWQNAHNPGDQLRRSVSEFQNLAPFRPVLPVGSAYKAGSWAASPAEVVEFLRTAQSLNLSAANFWEWADCRTYIPEAWDAIRDYNWSGAPAPQDITQQLIAALNKRSVDQAAALYTPTAVHITSARTVQGSAAIRAWYHNLLTQILPNAAFTLVNFTGSGSSRHFTWTATSSAGSVKNGSDTLGIMNGKIAYHYSSFKVT